MALPITEVAPLREGEELVTRPMHWLTEKERAKRIARGQPIEFSFVIVHPLEIIEKEI